MAVDDSLLERFEESRKRHDAARRALPDRWRNDPRPEVQAANEVWVSTVVRARGHEARIVADILRRVTRET